MRWSAKTCGLWLLLVCLVTFAAGVLHAAAPKEAADEIDPVKRAAIEKDLELFQGTWTVTSMLLDGKLLAEEKRQKIRLKIKGEDFTFDGGDGPEPGIYKIDPTKVPKELNIVITEGKDKGKVYLAIYKFEDGKMIQCMELANTKRPRNFTGRAGTGCALEVWQRENRP